MTTACPPQDWEEGGPDEAPWLKIKSPRRPEARGSPPCHRPAIPAWTGLQVPKNHPTPSRSTSHREEDWARPQTRAQWGGTTPTYVSYVPQGLKVSKSQTQTASALWSVGEQLQQLCCELYPCYMFLHALLWQWICEDTWFSYGIPASPSCAS